MGIEVIALHVRPKALEYLSQKIERDIGEIRREYLEIEYLTGCPDQLKFGHNQVEASVTMKKTPDNTLPIFWHERDHSWYAPFPR